MAFNNTASAPAAQPFVKAKAFVNLTIPRENADGSVGNYKVVGIPLREENHEEKMIIEWLMKDPANVAKLLSKMQANFQLVKPAGSGKLKLED